MESAASIMPLCCDRRNIFQLDNNVQNLQEDFTEVYKFLSSKYPFLTQRLMKHYYKQESSTNSSDDGSKGDNRRKEAGNCYSNILIDLPSNTGDFTADVGPCNYAVENDKQITNEFGFPESASEFPSAPLLSLQDVNTLVGNKSHPLSVSAPIESAVDAANLDATNVSTPITPNNIKLHHSGDATWVQVKPRHKYGNRSPTSVSYCDAENYPHYMEEKCSNSENMKLEEHEAIDEIILSLASANAGSNCRSLRSIMSENLSQKYVADNSNDSAIILVTEPTTALDTRDVSVSQLQSLGLENHCNSSGWNVDGKLSTELSGNKADLSQQQAISLHEIFFLESTNIRLKASDKSLENNIFDTCKHEQSVESSRKIQSRFSPTIPGNLKISDEPLPEVRSRHSTSKAIKLLLSNIATERKSVEDANASTGLSNDSLPRLDSSSVTLQQLPQSPTINVIRIIQPSKSRQVLSSNASEDRALRAVSGRLTQSSSVTNPRTGIVLTSDNQQVDDNEPAIYSAKRKINNLTDCSWTATAPISAAPACTNTWTATVPISAAPTCTNSKEFDEPRLFCKSSQIVSLYCNKSAAQPLTKFDEFNRVETSKYTQERLKYMPLFFGSFSNRVRQMRRKFEASQYSSTDDDRVTSLLSVDASPAKRRRGAKGGHILLEQLRASSDHLLDHLTVTSSPKSKVLRTKLALAKCGVVQRRDLDTQREKDSQKVGSKINSTVMEQNH